MWIIEFKKKTYSLTIVAITQSPDKKLHYEILVNDVSYSFAKSYAIDDFEQSDDLRRISLPLTTVILKAIRKIEALYAKNQSIAFLNAETKKLFHVRCSLKTELKATIRRKPRDFSNI